MNIYEELGLQTIVNASDTYTKIGGSRMDSKVLDTMKQAANCFVNISLMAERVGKQIALITNNESAFVSSGCSACLILASAALMVQGEGEKSLLLPDTSALQKNEFIVFKPQTRNPVLPYWRLIPLSGAKLVVCEPTLEGLKKAINDKTAGLWYFAGGCYEDGVPKLADTINVCKNHNIPVLVDAAAQLPPVENLWYYTRGLGADGVVFSGGKYIKGPQSTGLFLGRSYISDECRKLSNPNVALGRPFKVGKEEYAGLYRAIQQLVQEEHPGLIQKTQNQVLDAVEDGLHGIKDIKVWRSEKGRLGQSAPRLFIKLPKGKTGEDCYNYLYNNCCPQIDIGYFMQSDKSGAKDEIFINSINLTYQEAVYTVGCVQKYLQE